MTGTTMRSGARGSGRWACSTYSTHSGQYGGDMALRLPSVRPDRAAAVRELLARGERSYSFEFFPPRSDAQEEQLWRALRRLEGYSPTFVSVTYGAGGTTRMKTVETTERIAADTTLTPVGHLTAGNHPVAAPRHGGGA